MIRSTYPAHHGQESPQTLADRTVVRPLHMLLALVMLLLLRLLLGFRVLKRTRRPGPPGRRRLVFLVRLVGRPRVALRRLLLLLGGERNTRRHRGDRGDGRGRGEWRIETSGGHVDVAAVQGAPRDVIKRLLLLHSGAY